MDHLLCQFWSYDLSSYAFLAAAPFQRRSCDELDLRDIGLGASATASFVEAANNTSGMLTVSNGTHAENLTLLGKYGEPVYIAIDDAGGTIVTDASTTDGSPQAKALKIDFTPPRFADLTAPAPASVEYSSSLYNNLPASTTGSG